MAFAANEYQLEGWNRRDPRLKASVVIPYENGEMSCGIRKRAGDRRFAHVLFLSRTSELLGKRRYWPISRRRSRRACPSASTSSAPAAVPMSSTGWPSFYIEEITEHSASLAARSRA